MSEPENTPQDTVEEVVVGVDVEEVKRKRGRPKKPEEEKVKKEPKPKNENETRGRKIKEDKIVRTPEENKEYFRLYYHDKLKYKINCPVCGKELSSLISLNHHIKHNTRGELMRCRHDVETILGLRNSYT